jgi:hypothetical protein
MSAIIAVLCTLQIDVQIIRLVLWFLVLLLLSYATSRPRTWTVYAHILYYHSRFSLLLFNLHSATLSGLSDFDSSLSQPYNSAASDSEPLACLLAECDSHTITPAGNKRSKGLESGMPRCCLQIDRGDRYCTCAVFYVYLYPHTNITTFRFEIHKFQSLEETNALPLSLSHSLSTCLL